MTSDAHSVARRSERKPVRRAVVLVVESEDTEVHHEATTVDISAHGVRIEAEAALSPGQVLSLTRADDPTQSLRCLVVWTGDLSSDKREEVGLEFIDGQSTIWEN